MVIEFYLFSLNCFLLAGGIPGFAANSLRFPEKKLTIFITGNIGDADIIINSYKAAAIYLGEDPKLIQQSKYDEFKFEINHLKPPKKNIFNSDFYAGYYLQQELETVQQVEYKNNLLFIYIKKAGLVLLTLTGNDHEFRIATFGKGRFLVQDGKVIGMLFIEINRANNILWKKLPGKPICSN